MELMKQKQYAPLSVAQMAASLFAVENDFMDDIELDKIGDFEAALHSYMGSSHKGLMDTINATGDFGDDISAGLKAAIAEFKANHTW